MSAARRQDDTHEGPLKKLSAILAAASDPRLTSADRSIFAWFVDQARAAQGFIAYPGFALLRHLVQRNRRTVAESVAHLAELGYLEVVKVGEPGRRGRYRITFKGVAELPAMFNDCLRRAKEGVAEETETVRDEGACLQASMPMSDGLETIMPSSEAPLAAGANPSRHPSPAMVAVHRQPESNQHPRQQALGVDRGSALADAPGGAPPAADLESSYRRFAEAFVFIDSKGPAKAALGRALQLETIEEIERQAAAYSRLYTLQQRKMLGAVKWLAESCWETNYIAQLDKYEATVPKRVASAKLVPPAKQAHAQAEAAKESQAQEDMPAASAAHDGACPSVARVQSNEATQPGKLDALRQQQARQGYEAVMAQLRRLAEDVALVDHVKDILGDGKGAGATINIRDFDTSVKQAVETINSTSPNWELAHVVFHESREVLTAAISAYVERQLELAASTKARAASVPARIAGDTLEEFVVNLEHLKLCKIVAEGRQNCADEGDEFSETPIDWVKRLSEAQDEVEEAVWVARKLHAAGYWPPAPCSESVAAHALKTRALGHLASVDYCKFSKLCKQLGSEEAAVRRAIDAFLAGASVSDDDLGLVCDFELGKEMKKLVSAFIADELLLVAQAQSRERAAPIRAQLKELLPRVQEAFYQVIWGNPSVIIDLRKHVAEPLLRGYLINGFFPPFEGKGVMDAVGRAIRGDTDDDDARDLICEQLGEKDAGLLLKIFERQLAAIEPRRAPAIPRPFKSGGAYVG